MGKTLQEGGNVTFSEHLLSSNNRHNFVNDSRLSYCKRVLHKYCELLIWVCVSISAPHRITQPPVDLSMQKEA